MQYQYTRDPDRIRQQSYAKVRELAVLSAFTPEQQQVVAQRLIVLVQMILLNYI